MSSHGSILVSVDNSHILAINIHEYQFLIRCQSERFGPLGRLVDFGGVSECEDEASPRSKSLTL